MNTDRPTTLNFITGNANKLAEIRAILGDVVNIESSALDIDEIQGTIEHIAIDKARRAAALVNGPTLTEDTALCFTALNGLPGPYIKYFLEGIGLEGLHNLLQAYPDKSATAICTFAYCATPTSPPILFQGQTTGKIVPPRGPNTFGWDPIFQYDSQTYAEMDKERKNEVSHRSKALAKLKKWLAGGEVEAEAAASR